ncbi:MAG: tyrosine-type recombinase/integrase [Actinomycetota bacterium]|nr:tyrosine-type recombinase/integrase [Actinomycetota bacterium]
MNAEESLELYLKFLKYEKNLTPNTILSYRNDILLMLDYFKKNNISDVKKINLDIFRSFLKLLDKYQYSNNSIIRKYSSYINYFKFLERNFLIDIQLSHLISFPKKEKKLCNFLSESEIKSLLEKIDKEDNIGIRDRAIFELFYSTGARISEIVDIDLSKVDLENREVEVLGKGRNTRIVYLNDIALESLIKYLNIRSWFLFEKSSNSYKKSRFLFLNRYGRKLSTRYIRILLDKYLKKAEINKKISPHGIRHSFATHMLQEGAGIREVQELLGHKNINTTQIYTHLNLKKLKKDYEKFHPRAGRQ